MPANLSDTPFAKHSPGLRSGPGPGPLAGLLLGLLAAFAGPAIQAAEAPAPVAPDTRQASLDDLRSMAEIFRMVRQNYVDPVNEQALLQAAMEGMVASLDEHSMLLSGRGLQNFENDVAGRYGGVGIEVEFVGQRMVVVEVWPDTPAAAAGVATGDLVLAVDGVPVRGRKLWDSFTALHGNPGTWVDLRLKSPEQPARDLHLERVYINLPSVIGELLEERFAHLTITHFHAGSPKDLSTELEQLQAEAGGQLDGLILDLRDNAGGLVQAAVEIADQFLDTGLIVSARGTNPAMSLDYRAQAGEALAGLPLVVLVNRFSASASEILAGALKDHERATLVGEKTYGKGSIQVVLALPNGSALKLTTARYLTPAGHQIDGRGISPDLVLREDARAGAAKDQEQKDETAQGSETKDGEENDRYLSAALEILHQTPAEGG